MFLFLGRLLREPHRVFWRFLQCFFVWGVPKPRGNPTHAQIILTQAMPNLEPGIPSRANVLMADFVERCQLKLKLPIFAQGELAEVLKHRGVVLAGETPVQSTANVLGAHYLGTFEVAGLQKEYCTQMCYSRIIPVSAAPHIWRAVWVYERLGFKVIVPTDMPAMVFEKGLTQRRWRRAITAYPYELLARLLYLYKGYI
jgi:hypothetical protein